MAVRDISKYVIDVHDNASWQLLIDSSEEKLYGEIILHFLS